MTKCRFGSGIDCFGRADAFAAVGGSDSHGSHQRVGRPQTVVHADKLSTPALVDAMRRGHSYIAESSAVTFVLTASSPVSGEGRLRWTTTGVGAHFARVEVRRQARLPSMVALTNPVFLRRVCADGAAYSPRNF